ncbi:Kappa-type opioid receptor [Triplophysa tibetana]|uniref:Kappa-type opioid receptor n=1 Tax=Triplophysa tibetana TaxID=1572043 RepID=A0A5A9PT16_9TELE|nr:Kappa-type opioid receptor [Triplophysa tibetana]
MDFNLMEILKDNCQSTGLDDCGLNASLADDADARNATLGDGLTHDGMSPLIMVITAVYSMVFVVGLVGNCLVMYVIIRWPVPIAGCLNAFAILVDDLLAFLYVLIVRRYTKMKTATNIYIFNLALADALVTTTMPFQSADYLLSSWPFGEIVCKVFISIDYYNMFTSIFTLTMMSVDRYVAVCHPIKALDFRTPLNAKGINVGIWMLSSAAGIPAMVLGGTQTNNGTTECTLQFPDPYEYWDTVMKICVFGFGFVAPVLIISVCYSLMLLRLRSVRLLSGSREKDRNLRRITRLVLVVVAAFIICWTPIHIFILLRALVAVPETTAVMAAYFLCVALGYTNSSLNPVLYAFLDENFKRCFKDFCLPARGRAGGMGVSGRRVMASREAPELVEIPPRTAKPA